MTVIVTLPNGQYRRYGDVYVKRNDGTLDVIRGGAKRPYRYAPEAWTDVAGDQKTWKTGRFWG